MRGFVLDWPYSVLLSSIYIKKALCWDFPGGPVVKNLSAKCKGHGFDPWSKKIPHTVGQLSQWATTAEALMPRACAPRQQKPPLRETQAPQWRAAATHHNWRKPTCSNQDPICSRKRINTIFLKKHCAFGTSLAVQWLRLCASKAGDMGSIPGLWTKIAHAVWWGKKKNLSEFLCL